MFKPRILEAVRKEFKLDWYGMHGAPHWSRVREFGLYVCQNTKAKRHVVELFAILHDSKRINEDLDPGHGERAANFVDQLQHSVLGLNQEDKILLQAACRLHSEGLVTGDITVLACWDADRLDLGRYNTWPDPKFLCTEVAKDPTFIKWAYRRSQESQCEQA